MVEFINFDSVLITTGKSWKIRNAYCTVNVIRPSLVLTRIFLAYSRIMQRKDMENSLPVVSLQKAGVVLDTAVETLVIRAAFIRESVNQM